MVASGRNEGILSPYRVLDLTDEKGNFCGKLLGDMGADVIKVEPPGGNPARKLSPFYHDEENPETSLFWFAYDASKRGITIDIASSTGKDIFKKLVKTADFVVESYPPGYMGKLGLSYKALEKINPGIIMVSITPFGQTGPYKDFKGPDIVTWAMGGRMYGVGYEDRPPTRVSYHGQMYVQAGLEGAMAAVMALNQRAMTGEGQHIDLSIQAAAAQTGATGWDISKVTRPRGGLTYRNIQLTRIWQCKDGLINWIYMPGTMQGRRRNQGMIDWLTEEGLADDFFKNFDWDNLDYANITQDIINKLEAPTREFFLRHTKVELLEGAVKHRIFFYPQFTTTDLLESVQLEARGYWVEIEHPELNMTIKYPGAFAVLSETPIRPSLRAPHLGEHNREVYGELGIPAEEIETLKQTKVI